MIIISKNKARCMVTRRAYEEFYKSQGWGILSEGEKGAFKNPPGVNTQEEGEKGPSGSAGGQFEELMETPLSEMDLEQLQEYARGLDIPFEDLKKARDLRKRIREYLEGKE